MYSSNQKNILENLPLELIIRIGGLLNERTRTELALTSKSLFQAFTYPSDELYPLKGSISTIDLYKVKHMLIENRHYQQRLVNHVLNHAPNLEILFFAHRKTFHVEFIRMFLNVRKDKLLVYTVPEDSAARFQILTEYEGLSNITISSEANLKLDVADDAIVTPEHINRHIQMIKRDMKRNFFYTDKEKVRLKTELSHQLPLFCNQLFQTKNYTLLSMERFDVKLMDKETKLDLSQAKQLVKEVGPAFVESVIILQEHWFLVTSFSLFIHDPNRVDDCADKSRFPYQNKPVAFVQRKTNYGTSSFELVFRIGYVEVLANSGFIGSTSSTKLIPFVGSALQQLPGTISTSIETSTTEQIFISKAQKSYETGNRIINQYYKDTSTLPWQFYGSRFSENGFKPLNPLYLDTKRIWLDSASVVIRTYALQRVDIDDIKRALYLIEQTNKPVKLKRSYQLIKQHLTTIKSHEQLQRILFDESKQGTVRIKKDLICIYNEVLSSGIKSENKKIADMAVKKYEFKKIDLFD